MSRIEARLRDMGIDLPVLASPARNHMSFSQSGRLVYISGQKSHVGDFGIKGVVGDDVDLEMAITAARLCGVNLIAAMRAACQGDLDRVDRVLKIVGFIQAAPDFLEHDVVINGCSSLIVDVFEDRGRHARSAAGVLRLPGNYSVQVEAVVQIL
ncbi:RidA family protein [Brevundimonas sp. Root1423]|uniref:RidA family protein n=1 Tax=Brevundimonas sp. Root1423 TaxID=1736462 RepID=UPI0006FE303D|nr:RidA family protein [Brevundimonas sp. Root1423]KQY96421.1 hypothetical protein ASD25_00585 [Brevundimonas sp. Root1423]